MPFTSTRVVHADWSPHHRAAAVGTLTAACTVTTGGGGDWTPEGGGTTGTPTTLYTGVCSFTDLTRSAQPRDAAGQPVAAHPYLIGIDPAAPRIPAGARVKITACPQDPAAVGRVLTVVDYTHDSLMLERVLMCDLDTSNQPVA